MSRRALPPSRAAQRAVPYAVATLIALWVIIPIYFIGTAAFSTQEGIYIWPKPVWPQPWSLETMLFFLRSHGVVSSTLNSVLVAGITLVLALAIGAPAGYATARFAFRGRDTFRLMVVSTRAFPIVILSIPMAVTFIRWGLSDSLISVALMHTALALPFTILITSSVFAGVPRDLEEAALTLGCNRLQAFLRVALPVALPGLAAAAIFTFVLSWNEVFAAAILTVRNRTLPAQILGVLYQSPVPYRFAGGFFMLAPSLVFIFIIRRYLFNLWGRVAE